MKRYAKDMRVCQECGRPIEIGETCNCNQPVIGGTRDGLRAICPYFKFRSSYHGRCYIVCGTADSEKHEYQGSENRNAHYSHYCCGFYPKCAHYKSTQAMKGEHEACKAKE